MDRTLRLYPWWCFLQSALFWQPVFVLWFSTHLDADDVLRLEALYFGAVVLLEVPSGVLADRIGRRPLLIASSLGWGLGAAAMAAATGIGMLAVGQLLLAAAMALGSGADSALHADALFAAGRGDELGAREGRARSFGLAGLAVSGAIGGALGAVDLGSAYVASAVSGLAAAGVAWRLEEAPRASRPARAPPSWSLLGDPVVRWVLAASVTLVVLVHVPYELLQPWLTLSLGAPWTPPLAGGLVGIAMGLGAVAAARTHDLARTIGVAAAVVGALVLQIVILLGMGAVQHPALLGLVALRSVGYAVAEPLLLAAVHPRLRGDQRATWLSVQSLVGRLAFSASLLLVASATEETWTDAALWEVSLPYAAVGAVVVGGLALSRPLALRRGAAPPIGQEGRHERS
jgi:MFS family permease